MSETFTPPACLPTYMSPDVDRSIAFYTGLGFHEIGTMTGPDGKAAHTMLATPCKQVHFQVTLDPEFVGPACGSTLYCRLPEGTDVDETYTHFKDGGATIESAPETKFWGDRTFTFLDPDGHSWTLYRTVAAMTPPPGVDWREPAKA